MINLKQQYLGTLILFIGLTSSQLCANEIDIKLNCINVNTQFDVIEKAIDSGNERVSLTIKGSPTPTFDYEKSKPFSDYLEYSQSLISLTNPKAKLPCPIDTATTTLQNKKTNTLLVSDLVAPFELKQANSKKAILLIHGLTDSPFMYHDLSEFFYQQGYTVRTLLLPGHGTAPSGLLDVTYQEWQQATEYAIDRTIADFDEVYLGGFSTGGALIFDYLMQRDTVSNKISGLLMWSPAYRVASEQAYLAEYVDYIPFVNWLDKDADIDFAKYESFTFNAAAQIYLLTTEIDEASENTRYFHNIPLFTVVSEVDQTVNTAATLSLIDQWHSPSKRSKTEKDSLIYYGDLNQVKSVLPRTIKIENPLCNNDILCKDILGISHGSVIISPQNNHYGVKGKYRNCGHYLSDTAKYLECKKSALIVSGETTTEALAAAPLLQRLTYNPYYFDMLKNIKSFMKITEKQ